MRIKLHPQERLRNIYRQSRLFLVKPALLSLALIFLPWYFLSRYNLADDFRVPLYLLFAIALVLFLRRFIVWFEHRYVITNKRLLLYSHTGLFQRAVIDTPLERILNVSYKTTGVVSSVFGFGDVEVQVVGLMEPVIFKRIPNPSEIKDYIWELHRRLVPDERSYDSESVPRYQEKIGYTKKNQKLL